MGKISFNNFSPCGTRWGFYGQGNYGKTTLAIRYALNTKGNVAVLDAEGSVNMMHDKLCSLGFDMERIKFIPANDVETLFSFIDDHELFKSNNITSIVIDTMTVVDGWYGKYICRHFRNDPKSGGIIHSEEGFDPPMKSRESFGFGKDNTACFEANDMLLDKLDRHIKEERDVFLVMQECNPEISDARVDAKTTIMRLQNPSKNPKYSIALRVKEWLDNLGYVFRYKAVDENGKTIEYGERMIAFQDYKTGVPGMDGTFWAKGRTVSGVHPIKDLTANAATSAAAGGQQKEEKKGE